MPTCEIADCERNAAVRLHVPWRENMDACPAHARVWGQKDGVVADPYDEGEFP